MTLKIVKKFCIYLHILLLIFIFYCPAISKTINSFNDKEIENKVDALLSKMTIKEKIGQMILPSWGMLSFTATENSIKNGQLGGLLNITDPDVINKLQRIAVKKSRLGIPLIIGRDVIHGFKTIFPIPLAQAASWNPDLIKACARVAAQEASAYGINWTFSPMVDISRDPRWGRIAESPGEDPFLASAFAKAMVNGFQGDDLADKGTIAACAKHFAGYGAAEGGRDYNTTWIPEQYLRNVYLVPFKACVDAGVSTIMTAFNEINGIPASGNEFILNQILRKEWKFNGFVVSDWTSIKEMIEHGFTPNKKEAAFAALNAGVDMEMVSTTYAKHLKELVTENKLLMKKLNNAVKRILRIKYRLGLFKNPYTIHSSHAKVLSKKNLNLAKKMAKQSIVLLKNDNNTLPLSKKINTIAVIGPMANAPWDQLGTWVMDGNWKDTKTPLKSIRDLVRKTTKVLYAKGLDTSRSMNKSGFKKALEIAEKSDVILLFLGEESSLSGEAHCRAFLNLPGAQEELLDVIEKTGKPIILIIMAGRALTLENTVKKVDSLLFAWHPGTMGGPAIAELIFGESSPSGKLPVTFPRTVGQIPLYYAHKNTGRAPTKNMKWIPTGTPQNPIGYKSYYLDVSYAPLYPFGFGLSYSRFEYKNIKVSSKSVKINKSINISVDLYNKGKYNAVEVVQLYIRDLFGSATRPVKELKGFKRVKLRAGEKRKITFKLHTDDLAFYNKEMKLITEPGKFHAWIGTDSEHGLRTEFEVK